MPWWGWVLVVWCAVAVPVSLLIGVTLRRTERIEWLRRGAPDRRSRPRTAPPADRAAVPPPAASGAQPPAARSAPDQAARPTRRAG